jgi:replicative DNA helicase
MNNNINEKIILDCCIRSSSLIHQVIERVQPEDFYEAKHRTLYKVIKYLYSQKLEISLSSIYKYLIDQKKIDDFKDTVLGVMQNWTGAEVKPYIDSLLDDSSRRKLDYSLKQISEALQDKNNPVDELCHKIDIDLRGITKNQNSSVKDFGYLEKMQPEDMAETDRYYMTGFKDIDEIISGLFQSDFNLLGARPSRGKTALILNILMNIAKRYHDEHTLFFSLEMPETRLALRGVSQTAKVDSKNIRRKKYGDAEKEQIREGMVKLSQLKNFHYVTDVFKLEQILSTARRFAMNNRMSCMAVDYMQLIKHQPKGMTRDQALGDIGQEFKRLAKELKIPIIGVSSLKREVDFREDQRPVLADLRETGSLEYDSEVIMFLYKNIKGISQNEYFLEIAKNKDGALMTIELLFEPAWTLFQNF